MAADCLPREPWETTTAAEIAEIPDVDALPPDYRSTWTGGEYQLVSYDPPSRSISIIEIRG